VFFDIEVSIAPTIHPDGFGPTTSEGIAMATDEEILALGKAGKPRQLPVSGPGNCEATFANAWRGQRHNQFGEAPVGYIVTRRTPGCTPSSHATTAVRLATWCPTDEEGVRLLGTMVPMPAHSHWRKCRGSSHRHVVGNQAGPAPPNPHFVLDGNTLTINDRAVQELSGWHHGPVDSRLGQGS